MITVRKTLLITLLSYFSIVQLYGQAQNAAFRNLTSAEGLPTSSVTDVAQDSFGFIWIGSWDGVYRYDGKSFQTIYSGDARFVKTDDKGGVWISIEGGKLGYYNSYTDSIRFYEVPHPDRFIPIQIDNSGTVWAGTLDGIAKLDTVKGQFIKDEGQLPGSIIYNYFCASGNGELYFILGKKRGNYVLGHRDSKGNYNYEPFPLDKNNLGKNNSISDYIGLQPFDSKGVLIVNQYGWVFKTSLTARWVYRKPFNGTKLFGFSSAILDSNNNLWLNQANAISKINTSTGKAVTYNYNPQNPNTVLPMKNFLLGGNIFIDRQGVLWATRFSQGISRLNLYESNFGLLKYENGSPVIDVLSALELKDGSFWIGSRIEHNGLIHFSSEGKIIKRYGTSSFESPPGKTVSKELSHPFAWSIAKTSDGSIWIGTGSPGPEHGGINRIRPGSNLIERFKYDPHDKSSLSNNWDYKLLVDGSDRLWIGSRGALCFMNPITERITRGLKSSSSDSVDNTPYEPELVTSSGNLIIMNPYNNKHFIINHKTLEIKSFGIKTSTDSLFNYVYKDNKGRIWFIDGDKFGCLNSSFTHIAQIYNIEKSNIPIDKIDALCVDKDENIWLATSNGIFKFYPDTQKFRHFGFERGLQGVNFSDNLNYEGPSGKIYFSGYGGVNIFDPLKIKTNPFPPKMIFTGLKLDGRLIRPGKNSPIKKPIYAVRKVIVEPGVSTISINFAAIHFADAKYNSYKYKLEGFDDNWKEGGSIGNATYTNLSPGNYTLFIKGANLDGVWSDGKKSIEIEVLPPWWQTWWAYSIYILLFLILLWRVDKYQKARVVRKEKEKIQKRELEQAKEIEKAYTELKSTQAQLIHSEKMASLGELTAGIAHEIKNPLNFINNFSDISNELLDDLMVDINNGNKEEIPEIVENLKQNLEKINQHGKRADSIVKGMLLHSRGTSGDKALTDINNLLDEYVNLAYHGMRAQNKDFNITIEKDYDKSIEKLNVVPQDISRVFLNIINNACYAANERKKKGDNDFSPTLKVSTKNLNNKVEIRIGDNGNGIPADIKDKIFQPFFTTKPTGEGTGLGLSLSYDIIVKQHSGEIKIESKEGEGAEFILILPIT